MLFFLGFLKYYHMVIESLFRIDIVSAHLLPYRRRNLSDA